MQQKMNVQMVSAVWGIRLPLLAFVLLAQATTYLWHATQSHGYVPVAAKGHKESVYALGMNDSGTLLVSGGTEKVYTDSWLAYFSG